MQRTAAIMINVFDQFTEALAEAERVDNAAAYNADNMARFLNRPGVLHRVSYHELCILKRELRNFDMVTGRWGPRR